MSKVLGLSYAYHDSAAALVIDGKIIASAQEERFNRIKHYPDFPIKAINYCLQEGGITSQDLDAVVFYEKPYLKFLRTIRAHLHGFPHTYQQFRKSIPIWLDKRLSIDFEIREELSFEKAIYFIPHHLSHAASAFLLSPFEKSAILISDGVGEKATISYGIGNGNEVKMIEEMHYPHSIGLLYSAITSYLGFNANGGEGKTMGLADYGEPVYFSDLLNSIDVFDDCSFRFTNRYWNFWGSRKIFTKRFLRKFGPARRVGEEIQKHHKDMAASLQKLTEHLLCKIAEYVYKQTGIDQLCLAGGSFLNIPTNSKILKESSFKKIFVQPAASDAGGALGAALLCQSKMDSDFIRPKLDHMYWGPSYRNEEINRLLKHYGVNAKYYSDSDLIEATAKRISENRVVGWFQGRMELGPRALGNRSILASPRKAEMKDILNHKVKHREAFRPFGVSVLQRNVDSCFVDYQKTGGDYLGPFMLVAPLVQEKMRKEIPAAVHVNGSSRLQVVNGTNERYHQLLMKLDEKYNLPAIINTSFNDNKEPVVCSPEDAIKTFVKTQIDVLIIGNYVCEKN